MSRWDFSWRVRASHTQTRIMLGIFPLELVLGEIVQKQFNPGCLFWETSHRWPGETVRIVALSSIITITLPAKSNTMLLLILCWRDITCSKGSRPGLDSYWKPLELKIMCAEKSDKHFKPRCLCKNLELDSDVADGVHTKVSQQYALAGIFDGIQPGTEANPIMKTITRVDLKSRASSSPAGKSLHLRIICVFKRKDVVRLASIWLALASCYLIYPRLVHWYYIDW